MGRKPTWETDMKEKLNLLRNPCKKQLQNHNGQSNSKRNVKR